jgi:hypothetical protein
MSIDEFNDAIIVGIIKTLNIMKEIKSEGDNLNDVDFDQVIELRRRDMVDVSMLECIFDVSTKSKDGLK